MEVSQVGRQKTEAEDKQAQGHKKPKGYVWEQVSRKPLSTKSDICRICVPPQIENILPNSFFPDELD